MSTFLGVSSATYVVCSGIQKAFNFKPKWLALVVAQALCIWGTYQRPEAQSSDIVVAMINGFLVYLTALGGSALGSQSLDQGARTKTTAAAAKTKDSKKTKVKAMGPELSEETAQGAIEKRGFFTNWLD